MRGVIVVKRQVLITELLILGSIIVTTPQVAQAHSSGQSLSESEANRELSNLFDQGRQLVDEGNFSEALLRYQHATSLDQENPQIFSAIGYLQTVQSNFSEAVTAFQQAISLDSNNANFHYALAYNLANLGDNAGAAVAYRRTIELDANNVNAHLALGVVLLRQQDSNGALAAFQRVVALAPNNAIAYRSIGILLIQQERFAEAIEVLQKAAELDPQEGAIQLSLGIAWLNQGSTPEALEAFERAAHMEPEESGIIHVQIGRILQVEGNVEEALRAYREAVALQPDLVDARKAIADILMEQQDTLMAIVEHRQVIELAPTDASSYYHLGLALRDRGRIPEAIEALEQALNLYQQQNNTEQVQIVEAVLRELQENS